MWVVVVLFSGVVCGLAMWFVAPFLRERSNSRPVPLALSEENDTIAAVLARPERGAHLYQLEAKHFASEKNSHMWEAISQATEHTLAQGPFEQDAQTDEDLQTRADWIETHLDVWQEAYHNPYPNEPNLWDQTLWQDRTTDEQVVKAASAVYSAGIERYTMGGAAPFEPTQTPDSTDPHSPPLRRVAQTPPKRRLWFSLGAAAGGVACAQVVSELGYTGLAAGLAVASFVVLILTSAIIAWVDLDTLFLDYLPWAVGGAAAWALAAGASVANHTPTHIWVGVWAVVGVAVLFEVVNFVHKRLRGHDGQGTGDTLIIIATVGVPVTLVGTWIVAYWCIMASLLAAIIIWVVKAGAGKTSKDQPFAFGPLLAGGWVLGLVGYILYAG